MESVLGNRKLTRNALLAGVSALLVTFAVFQSDANATVDPPGIAEVLFVVSGYYPQEDAIKDHLNDLGVYNITEAAEHQIQGSTDLSGFDLIILTGFAPNISTDGLANIDSSGKPILIVEYWGFEYSYRLGLTPYFIDPVQYTDEVKMPDYVANTYARFLGNPVRVYDSIGIIEAVPEWNLAEDVVALVHGSGDFYDADYSVIAHQGRQIIATGMYETTHYTDLGWRMFDIMLVSLHQLGPNYANTSEAIEGYFESGLADYIDNLVGDEPADEVVRYVWERMSIWNLFAIEDLIAEQLYEINLLFILKPPPNCTTYTHNKYGPGDNSRWFLGETPFGNVPFWKEYIEGSDLGISVDYYGHTFFYMGDTRPRHDGLAPNCDTEAICNDAIVGLCEHENIPEDGIDVSPYLDTNLNYTALSLPGVHTNAFHQDFWDGDKDPVFTVPTGATVTGVFQSRTSPNGITTYYSVPTIMLWYATGSNPKNGIDHNNPRTTPRSWLGCSTNGLDFEKCDASTKPFSEDKPGQPARFIQVAPVPVNMMDLRNMCNHSDGYDQTNPLCDFEIYDDDFTVGGVLLYGNGRHYRLSGLYVAYMRNDEIGKINSFNKPIVHYLTKNPQGEWDWSDKEADATRILPKDSTSLEHCDVVLTSGDCKAAIEEESQGNKLRQNVFGEFSVKIITDGLDYEDPPALVMLSSHPLVTNSNNRVRFRSTRLNTFWEWDDSQSADAIGYGTYIIDKFTKYNSAGSGSLTLWFLTSKWGVPPTNPYGVYSDSVTISPWPN